MQTQSIYLYLSANQTKHSPLTFFKITTGKRCGQPTGHILWRRYTKEHQNEKKF